MDLRITITLLAVEPGTLVSANEIGADAANQMKNLILDAGYGPEKYTVGKTIAAHDEIPTW
jgi:hypothetical protein